jgi:hypothetical protein
VPATTDFPSILNQPQPRIRIYPRETVVAEKFEAMVQLGMTNSRMKDYYDLWFVSRHFELERSTFDRRATVVPERPPVGLTVEFANDPAHARQWTSLPSHSALHAPLDHPDADGVKLAMDVLRP